MNNSPCLKNCKDRSIVFCPNCEKWKEYKAKKLLEYEKANTEKDFNKYLLDKARIALKKKISVKKGGKK